MVFSFIVGSFELLAYKILGLGTDINIFLFVEISLIFELLVISIFCKAEWLLVLLIGYNLLLFRNFSSDYFFIQKLFVFIIKSLSSSSSLINSLLICLLHIFIFSFLS